ncbi:MAG TPA: hypothetical protein VHC22_23030 [Pirellulales bacterium]|nr:hypothetical protein [Pirellulales bacterium]
MADQHWHDRLRRALDEQGLPAAYSARLLEELIEHCNDLHTENRSMEAHLTAEERLGAPASLAIAAKKEYVKRSFAGRHPFVVFFLGPIVVTQVAWHLLLFVCVLLKWSVTPYEPVTMLPPTGLEWFIAYACVYLMRYLPFVVLAPFFMHTARKCYRPAWGTLACGLVAYMAFVNYMDVFPPTEKHNLTVGFTWIFGLYNWQGRFLPAAIPLVLSVWAWNRFDKSTCPVSSFQAPQPAAQE